MRPIFKPERTVHAGQIVLLVRTFRLVATGCAHLDMQGSETKFLQQKTAAQLTWLYQVR